MLPVRRRYGYSTGLDLTGRIAYVRTSGEPVTESVYEL